MEITLNATDDFEIVCNQCGDTLKGSVDLFRYEIYVDPCDKCTESAYEDGREFGLSE